MSFGGINFKVKLHPYETLLCLAFTSQNLIIFFKIF